jgi:hypothetical protein
LVLGGRDFRLVFSAGAISLVGDGITPVALTFAVLNLTDSATDLGIVFAARSIALVASLLVGGVVADRVGRRRVMVCADVARFIAQALLALSLLDGSASIAELVCGQIILGAGTGFFNPAASGLLPTVAGEHLQQANALRGVAMASGNIAGPAIAAALIVAIGPGAGLLVDAGSYAVSGLLLACVRDDTPPRLRQTFTRELREGFVEIRSRTWVWSIIAAFSVANTLAVSFVVLGAVVARSRLGGADAWAAILGAQAVGALVAGMALLHARPQRPLVPAIVAGTAIALPTVLLGAPAPLLVIAAAAVLAGMGSMTFNTLWETTLQQHVPAPVRSRVSSYDWFGSVAVQPIGFLLIGPLAGAIGTGSALYMSGLLELGVILALLAVRDVRTLQPISTPQ